MRKLLQWLIDWPRNHCGSKANSAKKAKPSPFGGDGSGHKAVLLSGPPGIGKTTCAVLCCQQLNLAYREMNASEARNKKSIEGLEMGAEHIERFLQPKEGKAGKPKSRLKGVEHVLIMDEVDGMSGNADRQGVSYNSIILPTTRHQDQSRCLISILNPRNFRWPS